MDAGQDVQPGDGLAFLPAADHGWRQVMYRRHPHHLSNLDGALVFALMTIPTSSRFTELHCQQLWLQIHQRISAGR